MCMCISSPGLICWPADDPPPPPHTHKHTHSLHRRPTLPSHAPAIPCPVKLAKPHLEFAEGTDPHAPIRLGDCPVRPPSPERCPSYYHADCHCDEEEEIVDDWDF